jgi:hypothetical protein
MSGTVSRRAAGQAWLTVNNVGYSVVSEPSWRTARVQRETLVSLSGIDGYKEVALPGFIAATIRDTFGQRVADFQDMVDVTVTLKQSNGKQISGTGMWTTEASEVNAEEATFAVRFEGELVEEL